MRYFPLILCLLVTACEREKREEPVNIPPPRAEARKATPQDEAKRREAEIIATAMKDPELRRLQADYDFGVQTMKDLITPDSTELLRYYALHHPDAGLAWLRSDSAGYTNWDEFIRTLYAADPEKAYAQLEQLTEYFERVTYLSSFCSAARGTDIERLWKILEDSDDLGSKQHLVVGIASYDPETSWRMWQDRIKSGPEEFLFNIRGLDPETPYPAHFFDQLPAGSDKTQVIGQAIGISMTPANLAPIIEWLEAQPVSAEYDPVYHGLTRQHAQAKEEAEALRWLEKISDPTIKEYARMDIEEARK